MNYDPSRTSDIDRRSFETIEEVTPVIEAWLEPSGSAYSDTFDRMVQSHAATRLSAIPMRARMARATEDCLSRFRAIMGGEWVNGRFQPHDAFIGKVVLDVDPAVPGQPERYGRGFPADGISELVDPAQWGRLIESYGDQASIPVGPGGTAEVVFAYVSPTSALGSLGIEAMAFRWTATKSSLRPKPDRFGLRHWRPSSWHGVVTGLRYYEDCLAAEADLDDLRRAVLAFTRLDPAYRPDVVPEDREVAAPAGAASVDPF